jgi:hypothetical protein
LAVAAAGVIDAGVVDAGGLIQEGVGGSTAPVGTDVGLT